MKKQSFISAFALVLLTVFAFSCAQDETLPTAAVQNDVTLDFSKAFPLPDEFQKLSEEELVAQLKTMTKEDMNKIAAEYIAENPVEERSTWFECMTCSISQPPVHPVEWSIPGYFIMVFPMEHYFQGCPCDAIHLYSAIAL